MSLRGKDVRPEIDPVSHERLRIMAEHGDTQMNQLAAKLLEKAIAYEWHEISLILDRSERLGKLRRAADSDGDGGGKG